MIERLLDQGSSSIHIVGNRGVGKSSLVREFLARHSGTFPGGVIVAPEDWSPFSEEALAAALLKRISTSKSALVIFDNAYREWPVAVDGDERVSFSANPHPKLRVISTGPQPWTFGVSRIRRVELSSFEASQSLALLCRLLGGQVAREFHSAFAGHPLHLKFAAEMVLAGRSPDKVIELAQPFAASALLGPDGMPLREDQSRLRSIETTVRGVNEELIARLAANPELLHDLHWRKYEELVAELFRRQGFDVVLTPPSNDDGVDLFAAKGTGVGSFLFVIDCKRWSPSRPVGPDIVRQLNGVVERERATHGIVATTSSFSAGARDVQRDLSFRLSLKDYLDMHAWLRGEPLL